MRIMGEAYYFSSFRRFLSRVDVFSLQIIFAFCEPQIDNILRRLHLHPRPRQLNVGPTQRIPGAEKNYKKKASITRLSVS